MNKSLVILCGGDSSRMGINKALLPFTDKCLLEFIVDKYSPYFDKIYLSVNQRGDYSHLGLDVIEIPDIYNNAGQSGAILSSLTMLSEDRAFFMSVDKPFLDPKVGVFLFENSENHDITTFDFSGWDEEITCGVYKRKCIATMGKCILTGNVDSLSIQSKCNSLKLPLDSLEDVCELSPLQLFYGIKDRSSYYMALFAALKGNFI
ncbi:MAG: NTP transferase domain-containing protein [Pseudobutyrivibrio sp.]|nr:NTP transferase domain-containing protein [Pseudobutyrivibrio sp.]